MDAKRESALNENQQRRLIVTCQYVDRLLADLDKAFAEAASNSPFGRYANDLAPAEQGLVRDYVARVRTQLLRMLEGQGLSPTPSRIGLRYSLLTRLGFVDIAVEELKPHYMVGYGTVAPEAETALNGIVEELHGTVRQLTRYLSVDRTEGLRARLERLGGVADVGLLDTLEAIIAKYGLVEFRVALSTVLDTLERRGLELAVFGRVSTGKSSLLNRLLGHDVLPVGVTPITAVPTRITFGPKPILRVSFADAPARQIDIAAVEEYASERQNPGNTKRVLRLVVELPSPLLESGVTLVDTPGLGSLATTGTAETLAYLPHCDVAAVLVDAASTLTSEDLSVIGLLLSTGIRVSVLLSKVDLLSDSDREAALTYTRQVLAREFNLPIPVAAVSVLPAFDVSFQAWRKAELNPLIANQDRERQTAAIRKLEVLRSQVEATLQRWSTSERAVTPNAVDGSHSANTELQFAAGQITALERRIDAMVSALPRRNEEIISRAAELLHRTVDPSPALAQAYAEVAGEAAQAIGRALEELSSDLAAVRQRVARTVQATLEPEDAGGGGHQLREVPMPALPTEIAVPLQGAERLLGRGLARAIAATRLEHAVGAVVRSSLDSYAAVLRRWALDYLDEIRMEWTARTDALRADIDRRLGHSQATSIDRKEVESDLQRLSVMAGR
jgi:GTP-binding protein EngB required for normal cell division